MYNVTGTANINPDSAKVVNFHLSILKTSINILPEYLKIVKIREGYKNIGRMNHVDSPSRKVVVLDIIWGD